ncbi:MAG: site-specific integrase, partial [Anaerolineales bacterium]
MDTATPSPLSSTPPTTRSLAEHAAEMLTALELSPLSKRTYRCGINAFLEFLRGLHPGQEPQTTDLDEDSLAQFALWLRDRYPDLRARARGEQRATRTAHTYLVAAKRLLNWLDLHEQLPPGVSYDRTLRRIDSGRGSRRMGYQQRRTDPDVARVITHYLRQPLPDRPGPKRLALLRNRALMCVLYDTGMRISEALALTREDVLDGRAHKVRLTVTKNGKPRTVFLSEESQQLLQAYCRERTDGPYAPLFASHGRGKAAASGSADAEEETGAAPLAGITPQYAWQLVKQAAQAEGLYDNTSPHSLRHRRAQDLLDEGMPLEWVAALLGHQHPDTTRVVYAWETDEERLADMVSTYGLNPTEAQQRRGLAAGKASP